MTRLAVLIASAAAAVCSAQESDETSKKSDLSHIVWARSWEAAVREAAARNVPIMVMIVSNTG
ncbi:MAG: hypothetical protein HY716_15710 [Planctomycetes bacterium]|nr:hypothetical protein [Planctomycetota bacterium]